MSTLDRIALYATLAGVAYIGYKLRPLGALSETAGVASDIATDVKSVWDRIRSVT